MSGFLKTLLVASAIGLALGFTLTRPDPPPGVMEDIATRWVREKGLEPGPNPSCRHFLGESYCTMAASGKLVRLRCWEDGHCTLADR